LAGLDASEESWTVLDDDWLPMLPIEQFFVAVISGDRRTR